MTQEFVTLPRDVVERALKVLEYAANDVLTGRNAATELRAALEQPDHSEQSYMGCVTSDMHELAEWLNTMYEDSKEQIAALEQPQAEQPAMTPIAQRKLDSLLESGYTISGYSIYHERKHQHGFVTGAGLVGWWRPEGMEYPQSQGNQEPASAAKIIGMDEFGPMLLWNRAWTDFPVGTKLYTHQQPKREPLTDEQILGFGPGQEDAEWTYEDQLYFARAMENAHNIK